jgi:hypothetical protein
MFNATGSNRIIAALRKIDGTGILPLEAFQAKIAGDERDYGSEVDRVPFKDVPVQVVSNHLLTFSSFS